MESACCVICAGQRHQQQLENYKELKQRGVNLALGVCRDDGSPIRDYRKSWGKARIAAGVPRRIVHDFRRTAVRNLERAGVSRSVATKLTGHLTKALRSRV